MIFMKMHLILNSIEVLCDKNPLFKIQCVLCGRLAINHSAGHSGADFCQNRGFNDKSVKTSKIVALDLLIKIGYGPIA